jgi:hypothetical protein
MPRWSLEEQRHIAAVRDRLQDLLTASPQYPEVVGDRKIVRFLRGHSYDVEKVVGMMSNFLKWRKEKGVDQIRMNVVEGGADHPLRFPKGELILSLIPQVSLSSHPPLLLLSSSPPLLLSSSLSYRSWSYCRTRWT